VTDKKNCYAVISADSVIQCVEIKVG